MGDVGEQLRAAREGKELTLQQVAEATRIPLSYLEALEAGAHEAFSSELHARGFLRNYASYLGLDPQQISATYGGPSPQASSFGLVRPRSTPARASHDGIQGRQATPDQMAAAHRAKGRPGRSFFASDLLLGLIVIAFLSLAGFYAMTVLSGRQSQEEAAIASPDAEPAVAATATVAPLPAFEGTAYTMDVTLHYAEHQLDVRERIDYTNVTSDTLPNIMLNVHPNHGRGNFELNEIRVELDGELVMPEVYPLDVTLRVELPRELQPNEHITLYLDFALNLPKISPSEEFSGGSFGYSKRSASLGNWYPVLAPYREEKGWYGLSSFPVGDPYVTDVADYSVTITTTEGVIVAGTGMETHVGNQWQYEASEARSFAFTASDVYQVETAEVAGVRVHSYFFPENPEAGRVALETASQALELYMELYGPYPYADYRVCETEFSGGMEFSGLTFLGSVFYDEYDGTTESPLIYLTAHEVSHQWFYGLVGNDQVSQPWLDEAMAEYSSYLFYEHYLPNDTDWWWFYAVDQWAPTGKIDSLIYEFRNNRDYLDAVYRRGAQFIRDLRETMGDPAFFGFLKEYQRRYRYHTATSRDFFGVVQEFTTADLIPLQEEYFRQLIRLQTP